MDSLKITDEQSAAVAVAPRVSLIDIERSIAAEYFLFGDQAVVACGMPDHPALKTLTICILVMTNGFSVIGKASPASPENFNKDLGRKFAREDAIRQLWPLMGFALRDRLSQKTSAV
ncbi:MAG: Gp49 family protein [Hyphomicrobiaceae bacterium]